MLFAWQRLPLGAELQGALRHLRALYPPKCVEWAFSEVQRQLLNTVAMRLLLSTQVVPLLLNPLTQRHHQVKILLFDTLTPRGRSL